MNFWNLKGWKRRGLASLFGVFATFALPPIYLLPFLVPAFSGLLLLLVNASTKRQAFFDGWWWGLGYFTSGLYWICISLYVEPEKFAWLTPFTLFGLPSVLAIYIGLVGLGVFYCKNVSKNYLAFLFAFLFVVAEILRAHLFTGFPWNLIGYTWTVSDFTLQTAALTGIYGLSGITVFIAAAPALFLLREKAALPNALAIFLIVFMGVFGWIRLEHNPTQYSTTKVRIVQANIAQDMKWDREKQRDILATYSQLTRSPGIENVKLVIWPEAAIPFYLEPDSAGARAIGKMIPDNTLLLAGGLRGSGDEHNWSAWNSLFVINHKGGVLAQYDKHHLVPFGEFIPFRNILPVENISGGIGDFSRGSGASTVAVDNISPFSPLICYEAIFPEEATDKTHKAKWLLNVTNDAWFGVSSGPYQHLQMARVRAVENGLPLVRAANTGISAVIDPLGRMLVTIPLQETGIRDFYLPLPKL